MTGATRTATLGATGKRSSLHEESSVSLCPIATRARVPGPSEPPAKGQHTPSASTPQVQQALLLSLGFRLPSGVAFNCSTCSVLCPRTLPPLPTHAGPSGGPCLVVRVSLTESKASVYLASPTVRSCGGHSSASSEPKRRLRDPFPFSGRGLRHWRMKESGSVRGQKSKTFITVPAGDVKSQRSCSSDKEPLRQGRTAT